MATTDELVEELKRRFEAVVVVAKAVTVPGNSGDAMTMWIEGSHLTCCSLSQVATQTCMKAIIRTVKNAE